MSDSDESDADFVSLKTRSHKSFSPFFLDRFFSLFQQPRKKVKKEDDGVKKEDKDEDMDDDEEEEEDDDEKDSEEDEDGEGEGEEVLFFLPVLISSFAFLLH